jgi:hypothetical protein
MGAKFFSGGFEEDCFQTCLPQQVFVSELPATTTL